MNQLQVLRFTEEAILPTRNHKTDAGLDLYSPISFILRYRQVITINLHIGVQLEPNTVGLILDRSSLGIKGIRTLGGVVDADYRGEIKVALAYVGLAFNTDGTIPSNSAYEYEILRGDKIAQLLIMPIYTPEVVEVTSFEVTERNTNGFGSSGR